jgi:hypothetical protein
MRRSAAVRFCAGGQPEMVVPAVIDNQRAEIGFQIMSALFCQRRERRSRHEQLSCSIVNRDSDNATISRSGERVRCSRHSRQNGDTAIWCSSCSDERGECRGHTSLADEKERDVISVNVVSTHADCGFASGCGTDVRKGWGAGFVDAATQAAKISRFSCSKCEGSTFDHVVTYQFQYPCPRGCALTPSLHRLHRP